LASLLLVLLVAMWESKQLASPGPLHPSHARVRELEGSGGCAVCHGEGEQSMSDACLICHKPIEDQMSRGGGLHGSLDPTLATACEQCHVEHGGGVLPLVADFSFHKAEVTDPDQYDHRHATPFDLTDRHSELKCKLCHTQAEAEMLQPGERRFLGLGQDCSSCHEDPHEDTYGQDCASCHGQAHPFDQVAAFDHSSLFPLAGGHSGLACKDCHDAETEFSIAVLQESSFTEPRDCAQCHNSPHWPAFIRGVSFLSRRQESATCSICHDPLDKTFLGPTAEMPVELHQATGFPLAPPHHEQTCQQCHEEFGQRQRLPDTPDLQSRFGIHYPGRSQKNCRACHGDPHKGQFDQGKTKGLCIACHQDTHFTPSTYDINQHTQSRFPLTGSHQAVACTVCHATEDELLRFVPTTTACADCHEDVHDGVFDGPDKPAVVGGREDCARCHVTSSFSEMQLSSDEHGRWTDYPLRGGHARASCTDCHKPQPLPDAQGRSFGKAQRSCAVCHVDPHAGQFLREGVTDCARCHTDDTDTFVAPRFDHERDSRFALDEHHRTLDCSACHQTIWVPGDVEIVRYLPLGTQCSDCHDSRHLREFKKTQ
jgi:hypothetical protein